MPRQLTLKVTRVFDATSVSRKRIVVNVGGARSSKSFSVAQVLLLRFLTRRNYTLIVTRKTFPSLRATAMHGMISLLKQWGVYDRMDHNKSESTITNHTQNNIIRFISIEDPTRVRSMEANDIWMEEANEFTYDDYLTLKTRLSSPPCQGEPNQISLTLNPSDSYGWVNQKVVIPAKDAKEDSSVEAIYSSYKDNPFLDPEYVKDLEGLKAEDETYYKIFALGVWAQSGSIIYNNYDIVPLSTFPQAFDGGKFIGLDFGYNHPSAAIFVGFKDREAWIKELVYRSHLTNTDLIDVVKQETPMEWTDSRLRADEAEPDRIEEFKRAGFDIEAAPKGKNSVKDGIDFCKRIKWHISSDSVNVIKEVRGYKWREKDGMVLDEPVNFMDDAMAAIRYAMTALKGSGDPVSSWGGQLAEGPEWA